MTPPEDGLDDDVSGFSVLGEPEPESSSSEDGGVTVESPESIVVENPSEDDPDEDY